MTYWRRMARLYPHDPFVQVLADRERRDNSPAALVVAAILGLLLLLAAWLKGGA